MGAGTAGPLLFTEERMFTILAGIFAPTRCSRLSSVVRDAHVPYAIRMDAFKMIERFYWR